MQCLQHLYSQSEDVTGFPPHPRLTRYRAAAAAGADGKAFSGDVTGLGVPVGDLRRAPACSGPLPALKPTDSHTVLIRVSVRPEHQSCAPASVSAFLNGKYL